MSPRIAKKDKEVAEVEVKEVEKVEEVVKDTKASADVYDMHGNFVRTYSKEVHGKDFMSLAEQFVAKKAGFVIK